MQQKEEAAQVELAIAQDHTIPPKSTKKGDGLFNFFFSPSNLCCFCYLYPDMNHIRFLSVFVDSKNSEKSEDEANSVLKSTSRKVNVIDSTPLTVFATLTLFATKYLPFCCLQQGRKKAPSTTKKAKALSVSKQNGTIRK